MPNLEILLDMVAEKLDTENKEAWFSSAFMTYAYGQVPLHLPTAQHCNFQLVEGDSRGTYRFVKGFYGLTVMPTEIQNVMDILLARFRDVFVFIDDILIVTKGAKSEHLEKCGKHQSTRDNGKTKANQSQRTTIIFRSNSIY